MKKRQKNLKFNELLSIYATQSRFILTFRAVFQAKIVGIMKLIIRQEKQKNLKFNQLL